ncbi:penicillin-binding protein 1A [Pelagirhabdus alkalitolerans]|uniref:Penicillin-binding protein 1A n=1 Tax=Pelagirhabdus alkalitolerans TaxID=1612202 RepID=A0A1G6H9L6_9BACI|nr:PBP1A family penicillin-binding protein [Pelagirhabdus alkalitolerans]SDB90989.1 penicillin-binding protein 1A [Pelagirhabdus alkalitolerans]
MADKSQSRIARKQELKNSKKKQTSLWKKVGLTLLTLAILAFIGAGTVFSYYIFTAPRLDHDLLGDPPSTKVYDVNGDLFADLGQERRTTINYNELPDVLVDAVLATEDVRFFDHSGVDIYRSTRAIISNITGGFGAEGGSTITQQVVKGSLLTPEKTMERKIQEQWLALQVERAYEKEDILEMYLNKIYFGSGAYGVATAAETYFSVTDLDELTLAQAAVLAGLPQRPSAYDPLVNPDLAEQRMNTVLNLMVRHDKISEEEAEEARSESVEDLLNPSEPEGTPYHSFLDQVNNEVEEKLEADIFNDSLEIHTTLDPDAQDHVEYVLSDSSSINFPDEDLQSGLVVLDTQSGAIRAIGGGRNRQAGGFNMALQAKRQPGSAIKPILDYGPAFEDLNWSTYQQIDNSEPYPISGTDQSVRNHNDQYGGTVSARYGMQQSLNVPALHALEEVGLSRAAEFASSLGVPIPENGLSIRDGIGGSTLSMSTLEMAGAYTPFGNNGIYNEPYAVTEVVFSDGQSETLRSEPTAVMSDSTAYMITDMLKTVVNSGTGTSASISGLPIAGKTGSTNDYVDVWFSGYTTNYTIAAWSGYQEDSSRSVPQGYRNISQLLFREVMSELSSGQQTDDFQMPDSVVRVDVERGSNPAKRPSAFTPDSEIVSELFKRGYEPEEESDQFEEIDPVSNLSAEYDEAFNQLTINWDHSNEDEVRFTIRYGTGSQLNNESSSSDTGFTIQNVERGEVYTVEITAVSQANSNLESDARQVDIQIPDEEPEEEEEEEPDEPEETEENGESSPPDDPGNQEGENGEPENNDENGEPEDDSSENNDDESNEEPDEEQDEEAA